MCNVFKMAFLHSHFYFFAVCFVVGHWSEVTGNRLLVTGHRSQIYRRTFGLMLHSTGRERFNCDNLPGRLRFFNIFIKTENHFFKSVSRFYLYILKHLRRMGYTTQWKRFSSTELSKKLTSVEGKRGNDFRNGIQHDLRQSMVMPDVTCTNMNQRIYKVQTAKCTQPFESGLIFLDPTRKTDKHTLVYSKGPKESLHKADPKFQARIICGTRKCDHFTVQISA